MRLSDVVDIVKSGTEGENPEKGKDDIFTVSEREYCGKRVRCLGARYVIKKCVIDYLVKEKGIKVIRYCDLEVANNTLGKPLLSLFHGVREGIADLKIKHIFISISHSRNMIAGMVLFCY